MRLTISPGMLVPGSVLVLTPNPPQVCVERVEKGSIGTSSKRTTGFLDHKNPLRSWQQPHDPIQIGHSKVTSDG